MITDNTPENDQATIITPRNTPSFQNIPRTTNLVVKSTRTSVYIQTQEYKRKDGVSTRVIDETTLRIYFPWVPEADLTIPLIAASLSGHY